jgi:hypothetical protein
MDSQDYLISLKNTAIEHWPKQAYKFSLHPHIIFYNYISQAVSSFQCLLLKRCSLHVLYRHLCFAVQLSYRHVVMTFLRSTRQKLK